MEVRTTQKFPSPFCSFILTPFPTDCKFYSTRFFVAVTNRYTYCVIIFKLQLTLKFFSGNSSVITTTHNKKSTVKDCEFCALNTQRTQRYILVSFTMVYLNRVRQSGTLAHKCTFLNAFHVMCLLKRREGKLLQVIETSTTVYTVKHNIIQQAQSVAVLFITYYVFVLTDISH